MAALRTSAGGPLPVGGPRGCAVVPRCGGAPCPVSPGAKRASRIGLPVQYQRHRRMPRQQTGGTRTAHRAARRVTGRPGAPDGGARGPMALLTQGGDDRGLTLTGTLPGTGAAGPSGARRRTELTRARQAFDKRRTGRRGPAAVGWNLLDLALVLAVVSFAVTGYQRGLVAGLVSLAGFVGGAVVGVWLLPSRWSRSSRTPWARRSWRCSRAVPAAVGQALAGPLAGGCAGRSRGPLRAGWTASAARRSTRWRCCWWPGWRPASLVPSPSPGSTRRSRTPRVLRSVQNGCRTRAHVVQPRHRALTTRASRRSSTPSRTSRPPTCPSPPATA